MSPAGCAACVKQGVAVQEFVDVPVPANVVPAMMKFIGEQDARTPRSTSPNVLAEVAGTQRERRLDA